MEVDVAKRHLAGEVDAHHGHARYPEKKNLVACDQQTGRVVPLEIRRILRPAQRRKWPKPRAEPGVQDIRVLLQVCRATLRALPGRLARNGNLLAIPAMPRRNAVSPPELSRQRPVADIPHPLEIHLAPVFGDDPDLTAL